MKKLNAMEMRAVEGGTTYMCSICMGRTTSLWKFLTKHVFKCYIGR